MDRPTPQELENLWNHYPSTVTIPDIIAIYNERATRIQEDTTYGDARGRSSSRRRSYFDNEEQRPQYRSRSRTTPYIVRPQSQGRRSLSKPRYRIEIQRPTWIQKGQASRNHEPKAAQPRAQPPPAANAQTQTLTPRQHSRPPLQNPAALPIAAGPPQRPASRSATRQHSATPQGPNKSPRLDAHTRMDNGDTDGNGSNTDPTHGTYLPAAHTMDPTHGPHAHRESQSKAAPSERPPAHTRALLQRAASHHTSASSGSPTPWDPGDPSTSHTSKGKGKRARLGFRGVYTTEWRQDPQDDYNQRRYAYGQTWTPGTQGSTAYDDQGSQSEEVLYHQRRTVDTGDNYYNGYDDTGNYPPQDRQQHRYRQSSRSHSHHTARQAHGSQSSWEPRRATSRDTHQ